MSELCEPCGLCIGGQAREVTADRIVGGIVLPDDRFMQCDSCGGELTTREDDNEQALTVRLKDYHEKTNPVLDLFRGKEYVITVDARPDPNTIQQEIRLKLGLPPLPDAGQEMRCISSAITMRATFSRLRNASIATSPKSLPQSTTSLSRLMRASCATGK